MNEVKLYKVNVIPSSREFYFPSYLHEGIGFIWLSDDEHTYFKFIVEDMNGKHYVSSPNRYCNEDITMEEIKID